MKSRICLQWAPNVVRQADRGEHGGARGFKLTMREGPFCITIDNGPVIFNIMLLLLHLIRSFPYAKQISNIFVSAAVPWLVFV